MATKSFVSIDKSPNLCVECPTLQMQPAVFWGREFASVLQLRLNVFPCLSCQPLGSRHLPLKRAVPPFVTGAHSVAHGGRLSNGRRLLATEAGSFAVDAVVVMTAFEPRVLEPRLLLWSSDSSVRHPALLQVMTPHWVLLAFVSLRNSGMPGSCHLR